MRKTITALAMGLLALSLTACDPSPGGACSQIGSQHIRKDGSVLTCTTNLNTGKGYWYEGKP